MSRRPSRSCGHGAWDSRARRSAELSEKPVDVAGRDACRAGGIAQCPKIGLDARHERVTERAERHVRDGRRARAPSPTDAAR